jgi:hypothetical protein
MIDMSVTTDLVEGKYLGKAKSDTHTEFVNPIDTSFVEQEHGERETTVLDFFGCKGAFMPPSEFRAKEIDEHPKEENIAEPSLAEDEHLSEETQDPENKEDKKMENHQQAEEGIVQVVQRPCSPNVIDFDNKKILIRSDHTESTKGKNVVIDINFAPRMIKLKNLELGVQKVNERKSKSAKKSKPIVKQLLDKYTLCKANKVFSRLGGAKLHRSPSRPGGTNIGEETRLISTAIFCRQIGAIHLLYIHSFLRGALITGSHILQGQQVIFSRSIFHRGLYSDHACMRKEQGSVRKLDYTMPL